MTLCLVSECQNLNDRDALQCQACGHSLLIHNQFRPLAQIGQGGFGTTFKAIDEGKPSRPYCVIKRLHFANENLRQESIRFFEQEAVHLEQLGNESQIPSLIWNGQEDGNYYIVQEYIDGQNLKQELQESGAFHEEKIWQILEELLLLLQRIHQVGVIHRDIKPENIIRRRNDRRLVLVDFGAVKVATQTALAKTGTSIGSAEFSAPEQIKGKPAFASDLYALGVSCIYLMTQVSPFDLYSDRQGEWVWRDFLPRDNPISAKLGKILDQLIALPLGQRFETAQGVRTAIHPPAPPPKPAERRQPEPPPPFKEPPQKPKKAIEINPTPAQPLGKAVETKPVRSRGMGRRAFVGLGIATVGAVLTYRYWPRLSIEELIAQRPVGTLPEEESPQCGRLDAAIQNPDVVAGLQSESYRVQSIINLDSFGQGGQQIDRSITRWIEDLGNGVLLHLVRIPAGTFTMGSPEGEIERSDDESPQHEVYIPECWMGQFEITQAQYQRITNQNPATGSDDKFVDPQKPIINVSWEDAVAFCEALSDRTTGRTYRLPTEAEWEYACRACTTTPFHFGESITPDVVNYNGNYPYANGAKGEYRQQTTPVGSFPPNPWGLYDMYGNVWEWCADQWYNSYNDKPDELKQDGSIAWTQNNTNVLPSESGYHLLRGGSWDDLARYTRSALRNGGNLRYNDLGFRVLLSSRIP